MKDISYLNAVTYVSKDAYRHAARYIKREAYSLISFNFHCKLWCCIFGDRTWCVPFKILNYIWTKCTY
jgi:hypothetical protein